MPTMADYAREHHDYFVIETMHKPPNSRSAGVAVRFRTEKGEARRGAKEKGAASAHKQKSRDWRGFIRPVLWRGGPFG